MTVTEIHPWPCWWKKYGQRKYLSYWNEKINVTFSTILFIPISHTNLVMKVLSDNKINTVDLFIFTDVRHIWLLFFALKITCPDNTVIPISRKEKLKQYICITTVDIRIEMLFINRRIATFYWSLLSNKFSICWATNFENQMFNSETNLKHTNLKFLKLLNCT